MTDEPQMRKRLRSPEKVWETLLSGLPPGIGDVLWNVSIVLRWLLLPAAFLSIVVDLAPVIAVGEWLLSRAGLFEPLLRSAVTAAHFVVVSWRSLTEPILSWLHEVFPFDIPREVFDFAATAFIFLPALIQFYWTHHAHAREQAQLSERARELAEELRQARPRAQDLSTRLAELTRCAAEANSLKLQVLRTRDKEEKRKLRDQLREIETRVRELRGKKGEYLAEALSISSKVDEDKALGAARHRQQARHNRQRVIARRLLVAACILGAVAMCLLLVDWLLWPFVSA